MLIGRHLTKYYKAYFGYLILGVLFLILTDISTTQIPTYLGQVVDNIENLTWEILYPILLWILLFATLMFIGRIFYRLNIFYVSRKIAAGLRHDMFAKSERLSTAFYHETKVGSIMSWFTNDVEQIEDYFGWGTVMLVDAIFLSIITIVRMVMLSWALTLVAMIPILFIVVWGSLVERFMSKKWQERQEAFDSLYDFAQENFTGIRVIKAFAKETQEIHAFAKVARKNKEVNYNFAKVSVLFDIVIEVIIVLVLSLTIGFGSWIIYSKATGSPIILFGQEVALTSGELVTFVSYFDILIWPMIALGSVVMMLSRAKTSLKRIDRLLDAPEDIKSPQNAPLLTNVHGKIEFKNLSFSYDDGGDDYLKNVSFEIAPGEHVGIVGKIGSGKTTLVNLLLRLYNVPEGTLFIDGQDVMKYDVASVREAIAYAPQDNFLFSDSLEGNIAFSADQIDGARVYEAAQFADVDENIREFPLQYKTVTGERGVTLSGGQKQRVSLARAYYKDAPILIMDDTVSAVDLKTEESILKNIHEHCAGKTVLIVASRASTVRHMDKILVMNNGSVEGFGNHETLLKSCETYQNMVRLQELEKAVEEHGK